MMQSHSPSRPGDDPGPVEVRTNRAAFIISIDTEMAWGLVHRPDEPYTYPDERDHLGRLLDLFDRYAVPATWAIVGHLFLSECAPVDGRKHPEIIRPDYDWFEGDWFDGDPCSDLRAAPTWYGPDVVQEIGGRPTPHEIASHGFSHMIAGDPGCSPEAFSSEVEAALRTAAASGVELRTFIHPRNRIGHVPLLAERGFRAFRGKRPQGRSMGPVMGAVDRVFPTPGSVVHPVRQDGMWSLPATCMFDVASRPRTWRLWITQVERRLRQAVHHQGLFHLWFHPHNLRDDPDAAFAALERLCSAAARWRDRGVLDTVTMGAVASELDADWSEAAA